MARNDIKNSSLLKTKFLIYAFNGRTKNFIVYGRQIIKNHNTGERRKVFSITKYTIK